MISGYKGRFCGAGLNDKGFPFVVQAVCARSQLNKDRIAVAFNKGIMLKHNNPESVENLDLIEYNAIITSGTRAVSANGLHSYDIINASDLHSLENVLEKWSYEPDKTPRIACLLDAERRKALFGIVFDKNGRKVITKEARLEKGRAFYLTTYEGNSYDIKLPSKLNLKSISASGSVVQIAEMFCNIMNPEYFVCSSSAILENDWKFAVKNRS
jgi:IMP cyclohydrolase